MSEYKALNLHPMPRLVSYCEPGQELPAQVKEQSPAILVMTDLRKQTALTIEPNVSIDWALQRMKSTGVRLLFVVNTQNQIMGLITATDIQGEKPQHLHRELNLRREEMVVRDIMTPYDRLEVIYLEDVLTATVGDIVATLRSVSRRHALVLDNDPRSGRPAIRGIFSITQIGKQIGRVIDIAELAHTFAEVEMALNS